MRLVLVMGLAAVAIGCGGAAPAVVATPDAEIYGTALSKSGQPLESATIAASIAASKQTFSAVADAKGKYSVKDVPPGVYVVSIYFRDSTVQRTNIRVSAGKRTRVDARLDPDATGTVTDPTPAGPDK